MPTEEIPARRSNLNFDTVLPRKARAEITRPPKRKSGFPPWLGWLLLGMLAVEVIEHRIPPSPPQALPAPPVAALAPTPPARSPEFLPTPMPVRVRRAELVVPRAQPVVRRAELVAFPNWESGHPLDLNMPYGEVVHARYLGRADSEADLPLTGNTLGDLRLIGTTPWIWTFAPGAAVPQWVDP
jgi:hypothetical protein